MKGSCSPSKAIRMGDFTVQKAERYFAELTISKFYEQSGHVFPVIYPPQYADNHLIHSLVFLMCLGYAGVYLLLFLIFVPKHRLWVLVRTASTRRF